MLPRYPLVEQETAKDAVLGDGSVRMAGEAVSGRYGARHAVADEAEGRAGGPQRRPASDDRSLVDRLLAGNGNDRGYDWGWGDPATGELVTDREPLHDIPELWGPQEDRGEPTRGGPLDKGAIGDGGPRDRSHDDRDWADRSLDDLGSDDLVIDGTGPDGLRPGERGVENGGSSDNGFVRGFDERPDDRPDDRGLDDLGLGVDPLDALATGRVRIDHVGESGTVPDRDVPDRDM